MRSFPEGSYTEKSVSGAGYISRVYFGARYYDPVLSNWISADPAFEKYLPTASQLFFPEDKFDFRSLPGIGGVYNSVNLNVYHYAGQNPVKLVDPDGNFLKALWQRIATSPATQRIVNIINRAGGGRAYRAFDKLGGRFWDATFKVARVGADIITRIPGAIKDSRLWSRANNTAGILKSQLRHIKRILNIAKDHAKYSDFSGVAKELKGFKILKPGGGYYNHIGEMTQSFKDLGRHVNQLRNSLLNPNHSAAVRNVINDSIKRGEQLMDKMSKALNGQ